MNTLYYGDNLTILREHIEDESIDLVYLDPPFKSDQNYNVPCSEQDGSRAAAQITAFEDTWRWDQAAAAAYHETVERGGNVSRALQAFYTLLGPHDMMAYIAMMAPRLVELRRVLRQTGSIYLHCDPAASHYLKLLMDSIFGSSQFLNEIVWKRSSAHSDSGKCGNAHDTLLLYRKGEVFTWNRQYQEYDLSYVSSHYRMKTDEGRLFRTDNLTAMGLSGGGYEYEWNGVTRIWRCPRDTMQKLHDSGRIRYTKNGVAEYIRYLDEMPGVPLQDIWTDISPINSQAQERLGYPTQKPEALLERIITASSNEDGIILDPFCGCGTAIAVAQRLNRSWVGIDITHLAISLIKHRLFNAYGDEAVYTVIGEPVSLPDARQLAKDDAYQFQWWAVGLVGARLIDKKKGADQGIDGRLYFHDDPKPGTTKQVILSVKSGRIPPAHIRELRGTVERENAAIGVLLTLEEPTRPMRKEAAQGGFYESPLGSKHPRIQILTIEELLNGARIDSPAARVNATYRRARRVKKAFGVRQTLPFDRVEVEAVTVEYSPDSEVDE